MPSLRSPLSRRHFLRSTGLLALTSLLTVPARPAQAVSTPALRDRRSLSAAHLADKPPMVTPMRPRLAPDVALDTKIGQMLLLGFRGTTIADDSVIARNVRDQALGRRRALWRQHPQQRTAAHPHRQTAGTGAAAPADQHRPGRWQDGPPRQAPRLCHYALACTARGRQQPRRDAHRRREHRPDTGRWGHHT